MKFTLLAIALSVAVSALQPMRLAGLSTSICVLQPDGQVYCSGENSYGQLGVGSTTSVLSPLQMLTVTQAVDICLGDSHTCILESTGQVKCTGYNTYSSYVLGDGTTTDKSMLGNVLGLETGVSKIFCGPKTTCAVLEAGGARCWGSNSYGELGNNSTVSPPQPVSVNGFESSGVQSVGLGEDHTCFLNTAGKLLCTGSDYYGQLGNGTRWGTSTVPIPVTGLALTNTFVSVSCGGSHTCAVTVAGAALCWGENYYGQSGMGAGGPFTVPQQVVGLSSGVTSIWISGDSTYAVKSDNTVMAFGYNSYGVLGNGNTTTMRTPIPFANGVGNIKEVRGGYQTTCILLLDDTVQCLGANSYGQFGTGTSTYSTIYTLTTRRTVAELPPTVPNTLMPTRSPTPLPTTQPTTSPSMPTAYPSQAPTKSPSPWPTRTPTMPTPAPTTQPTTAPSVPTAYPSQGPTKSPSPWPTRTPTMPTPAPTTLPTTSPSMPTAYPSQAPTKSPSPWPTRTPTMPTPVPTIRPTTPTTLRPTTLAPTLTPTTSAPTLTPTTLAPTTLTPTLSPTTLAPTTTEPSSAPTPTVVATDAPVTGSKEKDSFAVQQQVGSCVLLVVAAAVLA
ncbi:hypothetical protein BASA81_005551 [Batrachochytrium salamandrivorans]|nr:hypothetical protein BASA81_005551 [Batrachochytrium salamandrivorans]